MLCTHIHVGHSWILPGQCFVYSWILMTPYFVYSLGGCLYTHILNAVYYLLYDLYNFGILSFLYLHTFWKNWCCCTCYSEDECKQKIYLHAKCPYLELCVLVLYITSWSKKKMECSHLPVCYYSKWTYLQSAMEACGIFDSFWSISCSFTTCSNICSELTKTTQHNYKNLLFSSTIKFLLPFQILSLSVLVLLSYSKYLLPFEWKMMH